MSRKRKEAFSQAIVGLFMLIVIALLGYFTIVISGVDLMTGKSKVKMSIVFSQVGGLKDHDSVLYRGTKVGTVDRVIVTPSNLVVRADVDENVVLRERYHISVCNLSVLGGNYLKLEEGEGERVDLSSAVFRGDEPVDWMQDVSKIAKSMNELVNRPEMHEIVTNVAAVTARTRQIAERVDAVIARIERGEGLVGKLMSPETGKLYSDVENTVSNVNDVVARVSRGEGLAGKLLSSDEVLYRDLKESVAAFRKACESFDMADAKGDIRQLTAKGNQLVDNLNAVAERIRNGEGTVGKLMKEDGMYDEVNGLIKDCRQVIDNYRDTTPISTFSSLITGAL